MNTEKVTAMIAAVCKTEIENKDTLCKLDSVVGDGDHGFTVERGFRGVEDMLKANTFDTPASVFEAAGEALAESMGGAIGLIVGALFSGGAEALEGKEVLDAPALGEALEEGMEQIKMIGGAKEGDKTMLDALSPAVTAYKTALAEGGDLKACTAAAAKAGRAGSDATFGMMAKKGRAKFLMEKSKGYVDAGSVTMALLLETIADFCQTNC